MREPMVCSLLHTASENGKVTIVNTTPYWDEAVSLPMLHWLDSDLHVDVGIVGGGIVGVTAAYLLKAAGRTVALLDRDRLTGGDTGHTTAHLTAVTDTRLSELVETFGRDHARAAWDAGLAAIAQIDELVRSEQIACGFEWVPAYLHRPASWAHVERETAAEDDLRADARVAGELGFDAEFVDRVPFVDTPGVRFDGQARFHPRAYVGGLLRRVPGDGSHVFERSPVDEVTDSPLALKANGHTVTCDYVIVATHNPIVGKTSLAAATLLQTKLALYSSYVVAGRVPHGHLPDVLFVDTADPYNYLRLDRGDDVDVAILGGEDHKTGQEPDTMARFRRLQDALIRALPAAEVTHRWSGQVIETSDGLPYVGKMADRQFIATGFAGNGMTFGTVAAMMARDAILGVKNPWTDLFDPARTKLSAGTVWDYLAENKDYPYYLIRDRFAGPEGKSLRVVKRGEGRILDLDGERVAAYRAPDGSVTVRSAVCTHMGCLVRWNPAERTWDCPCHGSRFSPDGSVLAGPAESPLSAVSREALKTV
jgi:glycine/D-amino acid oxidase-like deaminating enzyme/nitrite reductase/ring-hydroxylating ferredoxin subunit